jgi:hypothetical protein
MISRLSLVLVQIIVQKRRSSLDQLSSNSLTISKIYPPVTNLGIYACFPISCSPNIKKIRFGSYISLWLSKKSMKKGHRKGQRTTGSFLQTAGSLNGFAITRIGGSSSLRPPPEPEPPVLKFWQRATHNTGSSSGSGSRWMWLVVDHSESNSLQNYLTNS